MTVSNPDPGAVTSTTSKIAQVVTSQSVTFAAATRFLEQSTFGPTPTTITQLQGTGFTPFLTDQFSSNVSTYADPEATDIMNNNLVPTQRTLFINALTNPDQLRQRVALALSEIWVLDGSGKIRFVQLGGGIMTHSRRQFIRRTCCTAAALGAASSFSRFGLINALAQTSSQYRALVCIFLFGGNDANNLVVPFDSVGYANYQKIRGAASGGGWRSTSPRCCRSLQRPRK